MRCARTEGVPKAVRCASWSTGVTRLFFMPASVAFTHKARSSVSADMT